MEKGRISASGNPESEGALGATADGQIVDDVSAAEASGAAAEAARLRPRRSERTLRRVGSISLAMTPSGGVLVVGELTPEDQAILFGDLPNSEGEEK